MKIFDIYLFGIHIAPSYYGLMYAIGFAIGYYYLLKTKLLSNKDLDDLLLYLVLGVILGGRIAYILFYDLGYYISSPLSIFKVWEGGMSFHGGTIGVIVSTYLFTKIKKISFLKIIDEIAVIVPIGLGLGRIGNYLNKELLGFEYNGFLSVEKNGVNYFPSPLVEAFLEGIVLFIILYFVNKNKGFNGKTGAFFLILYGFFRILVEVFFRSPDAQIGYILGFLSMGMILSFPMIIIGILLLFLLKNETKY